MGAHASGRSVSPVFPGCQLTVTTVYVPPVFPGCQKYYTGPSGVYSEPVDVGFLRQPRFRGCFGRLPAGHHQAGLKERKKGSSAAPANVPANRNARALGDRAGEGARNPLAAAADEFDFSIAAQCARIPL